LQFSGTPLHCTPMNPATNPLPPKILPAGSLALIDAIGPFFRGVDQKRINWSKIPYSHLATEGAEAEAQWTAIRADMAVFAKHVAALGYNAVSLDDLYHVTDHVWYEEELRGRIQFFAGEFRKVFAILQAQGLAIYVTADFLSTSEAVNRHLGDDLEKCGTWFGDLIGHFFSSFPEVAGVILRIGESDGHDVLNPLRSRLLLRSARQVNQLLKKTLPIFEARARKLIFRTWTVGAYVVGDLMWHRTRLAAAMEGIASSALVVSMKYGESDFFRYLPLNKQFYRLKLPLLVEFQARREHEGAGEYPSFMGWEVEKTRQELAGVENLVGFSVWCQTGGWHAFRRLAFLENPAGTPAVWIELNAATIAGQFMRGETVEETLAAQFGTGQAAAMREFLSLADAAVRTILYLEPFARQKLYFRRVRIPPLLHVYWDCLFVNDGVRKLMSHFVTDPEETVRQGEEAFAGFARMETLALENGWPVEDVRFMRDSFAIMLLARRYFLLPPDSANEPAIREAKAAYKLRWPRPERQRYRIRLSFEPSRLQQRTLARLLRLLVRRQRGYRSLLDRLLTIHILGWGYRLFRETRGRSIPKMMRKTAMGLDSLFR